MTRRVAVLGATGYSALELIKLLIEHPKAEIVALTTRQEGNPPISEIHQSLAGRLDMPCENLTPAQVAERADCVFACLPHGVTTEAVPDLIAGDCRVIDLSADYRLDDTETYEQWYGVKHGDPAGLAKAVYGLPELFGDKLHDATLVANPGCYPTTSILALAPLVAAGLIKPTGIIVDAKSGVSGAGRTPKLGNLYSECNESISAYSVGKHRHTPEIEQIVRRFTGHETEVIFTPHLTPMDRGILATCYAQPVDDVDEATLLGCLESYYADKPFVQVVKHLPATKDTTHTNYCHITVRRVRDRVLTISCLDNLIKGASGAAVQNFNLMYGYDETTGL